MGALDFSWYNEFTNYITILTYNKYPLYVAFIAMLLFMCNTMSRFVLIVTNVAMANEIHFGDKICRSVLSLDSFPPKADLCYSKPLLCDNTSGGKSNDCEWYYTGTGYEYQLLAGPLFNIIFSFSLVPMGICLERNRNNRKTVIAYSAVLWSSMVLIGGLSTQYWHLALTRLAIAFFEAPFTAFAISLLSSYFTQELRAMALSLFTSGIHFGFSMAFVIKIAANDLGWRAAYFVTGIPGLVLGLLAYITIREPGKELAKGDPVINNRDKTISKKSIDQTLTPAPLFNPLYIMIVLAAAARCGGGRMYSYNFHNYIQHYYPGYPTEHYLSWIPAVVGIFASTIGGIWADRKAATSQGYKGRLKVLLLGVWLSVPSAVLALYMPPPWCFVMLLFGAFFHDLGGGIITTVLVEQAPAGRQTSAMTIFCFTINMLGGNLVLLLPVFRALFGWLTSMLLLWPGAFAVSGTLFLWALILSDKRIIKKTDSNPNNHGIYV
ncbi:uncharacterized protein [Ptychodera flava]|uniref:uncharacterized protein n=1 Tax=Ptychodera flava TaxID=63121 RepID=UPI00396A78DB